MSEHRWRRGSKFVTDQHICQNCGLLRDERERNLPSQSTDLWYEYLIGPGKWTRLEPACKGTNP